MAKAKTKTTETSNTNRSFNAEVDKVLHLMINSLYTNKDIFLRELISNASDACDKLRYESIEKPDLLKEDAELKISLSMDKDQRTITIADNGIGMSEEELIENLGTIARSGTQLFTEHMTGDTNKDVQLIGQFGVGFYSAFLVADEVTVRSRKAGEAKTFTWHSRGEGGFTVEESSEPFTRGTEITLHIKEGEDNYLDKFRIEHIVTTYSDHIDFPIQYIDTDKELGSDNDVNDQDITIRTLNSASALWTKPKADITEEQYKTFYNHVGHTADDPWLTLHNKAEGTIEYTNLLFVPTTPPFDLFHPDRKCRVKLYVKRVFITDENVNLIPSYLRFLRGVIDSEDLPLNISRETLQHNAIVEKIRNSVVKRVLSELKKKANKDAEGFAKFWTSFGAVFKEGLCEGMQDREPLLEVCRFKSTKSGEGYVSLDEYIERMQAGQEAIYFLTGDNLDSLQNSPQLEGFKQKDIEVLLLSDHVDDFWVNVVPEYKEKAMQSITRSGIDLDKIGEGDNASDDASNQDNAADTPSEADITDTIAFIKATLGDKVKDVTTSGKLTGSPACLATAEGSLDIRMERFLHEQNQLPQISAKILEINPKHPIIKHLVKDIKANNKGETQESIAFTLFDQACIIEGEPITDTAGFSKRLSDLMEKVLG